MFLSRPCISAEAMTVILGVYLSLVYIIILSTFYFENFETFSELWATFW